MDEQMKKIAIIVTWFGKLPPYFPAWLKSAEYNDTIDFLCFSDQYIQSDSPNIIAYKTTLEEEVQKYCEKLGRRVEIKSAYKFCDCRLFFGKLYEDYLRGYDFWGYCDVDLVFGNIRKFVTNDVLEKYDRIYQFGHLCLYRNTEYMNNIYFNLPGGIYSQDEIFQGVAKTTPEEHFGINRICEKNRVKWYREIDFIDFVVAQKRLIVGHGQENYEHQTFLWENGKAFQLYQKEDEILNREYVYIHFQKRKPVIDCSEIEFKEKNKFVITADKIITKVGDNISGNDMDIFNPAATVQEQKRLRKVYVRRKMKEFIKANCAVKRIWLRQMKHRVYEKFSRKG